MNVNCSVVKIVQSSCFDFDAQMLGISNENEYFFFYFYSLLNHLEFNNSNFCIWIHIKI